MTMLRTNEQTNELIERLGLKPLFEKALREKLYFVWGGDSAVCFFPHELLRQMELGMFRHGAGAWTLADPCAEFGGIERQIIALEAEKEELRTRMRYEASGLVWEGSHSQLKVDDVIDYSI